MVEKVGVARRWEQSHCWGARAKALGQVCLVRLEQTEQAEGGEGRGNRAGHSGPQGCKGLGLFPGGLGAEAGQNLTGALLGAPSGSGEDGLCR